MSQQNPGVRPVVTLFVSAIVFLSATVALVTLGAGAGCGGGDDEAGPPVRFRLPVDNVDGRLLSEWVVGGDHDPEDQGGSFTKCLNYDGEISFPYCYDQHDGTDFLLDGGFDTMDLEVAWVVAAADGVVVSVEDGHYDRCHADVDTGDVSCDGHPMVGNHVKIEHAGGVQTWYWHFKKDTIVVEVNQTVRCGERLGLIGSSGRSAAPHLHFEVRDAEGVPLDPYAGEISGPVSWWMQQEGPNGFPAEICE